MNASVFKTTFLSGSSLNVLLSEWKFDEALSLFQIKLEIKISSNKFIIMSTKGFNCEKLLLDAKNVVQKAALQNVDARYFIRDRKIQIGRQLLNIGADVEATYIVIGLDGMAALAEGKEVLGSVSDFIVSKSRCTTIIAR